MQSWTSSNTHKNFKEVLTDTCHTTHPRVAATAEILVSSVKQAYIYTVKCRSPEWVYQDTAFSCSPNASRGPDRHSAPILASKILCGPFWHWILPRTSHQQVQAEMPTVRDTAPIRFPFNGFTHFFTLSSEFFSSFPHGTCSLSVSCQYLALDEVYHPLRTALSSNPTQRKGITKDSFGNQERGSHPLWQLIPKHLGHRLSGRSLFRLQSGAPMRHRF